MHAYLTKMVTINRQTTYKLNILGNNLKLCCLYSTQVCFGMVECTLSLGMFECTSQVQKCLELSFYIEHYRTHLVFQLWTYLPWGHNQKLNLFFWADFPLKFKIYKEPQITLHLWSGDMLYIYSAVSVMQHSKLKFSVLII